MQWQAALPAESRCPPPAEGPQLSFASVSCQPACVVSALQGLQVCREGSGKGKSAATLSHSTARAANSSFCQDALSGFIPGILKTAAVETGVVLAPRGVDFDCHCPGAPLKPVIATASAPDNPSEADVQKANGFFVSGSAGMVPVMACWKSAGGDAMVPRRTECGGYIVTGGMGMVGQLVAAWLAAEEQCSISLLGRSGRLAGGGSASHVCCQASHGLLTLTRCDLGSRRRPRVPYHRHQEQE